MQNVGAIFDGNLTIRTWIAYLGRILYCKEHIAREEWMASCFTAVPYSAGSASYELL